MKVFYVKKKKQQPFPITRSNNKLNYYRIQRPVTSVNNSQKPPALSADV